MDTVDTEPSSFARLRRADSEMKHVRNKAFFDMFLRSAVAPDAKVYLGNKPRQYGFNTEVDFSIRRY